MQPDLGMVITISAIFFLQLFIANVSLLLLMGLSLIFPCILGFAYLFFPHVQSRINKFMSSIDGENYQVHKSLECYNNGGLFGRGPGEGSFKYFLPDCHADFIFPVIAEEFGSILCFIIICIIIFIVVRGLINLKKTNIYRLCCGTGIIGYFAMQSIFNIGITLNLFPTKGMTLPFISYGGSSLISSSIAMGIYLNITKYVNKTKKLRKVHIKL
jgi:cell division protein FtsW